MLGLILDACVIIGLIALVNQGQDMEFGTAVISALIISVCGFVSAIVLAPILGVFYIVVLLPIAIIVIWMVSGIPLGRASIAGALFFVYRIIFSFALQAMLG